MAHRLSHWVRTSAAKRKCLCDPLTLSCRVHLRQLLFVELVNHQLDRADGLEQIAAALQASLGGDGRVLCTDKLPFLQLTHAFADSVGAHPHRSADSLVAGPATNTSGSWK